MPSIPQSLLWISLVVLWLFVLVPMLINKRDTVRRTSDVALATRVLNSRLLRKKRGPAAGHRSDPHWQPEADEPEDFDEDDTGPVVVTGKPSRVRSVAVVTSLAEEDELDYLDVDIVEEDSGALPVGKIVKGAAELQTEELPLEFASADTESVPVAEPVAEAEPTATPEPEVAEAGEPQPEVAATDAQAEKDADGTDDEYEYVDDTSGLEPEADEPAVPLRGAGRYATKTAAAVSARKYRFRTRMLLAMSVALIASAIAAFLVTPTAWYISAVVGAVTLLYLGYLRRQTRIEERLRRRRLQRMARAKLGVENTRDDELIVVPSRLRRPGAAVLEIDDEDPMFEHLEYASFAREYDLPRAAGQ